MDLRALSRSDIQFEKKQLLSLQTSCVSCIVEHLDKYSTEQLSLLPAKFRRQLLTCLPPLDIIKLEGTSVVSGLDMNEVWHTIAEHYAEADDTSVLPETFKSLYRPDKGMAGANFYKTLENDWRSIFLTRTLYIMLHSFNPSSVSTKVDHCSDCQYHKIVSSGLRAIANLSITPECTCWGEGMDPLHHDIFWRLIALPLRSELYYSLSGRNQTSDFVTLEYYQQCHLHGRKPFNPRLLVPNRHGRYLTDSSKTIVIELLTTLLKESCFRPKVVTINCGFMHYSDFYQHLRSEIDSGKSPNLTYTLFADMLSEVECLEFYWPSIVEKITVAGFKLKSYFDLDASIHTLTTVLGAIFKNPSPKLTSLCVSTNRFPKLQDCLPNLAPFFSADHYTEAKNKAPPISVPYAGLKNVHIFAEEMECQQDISSIIHHQSSVEGIELNFMYSFDPDNLLAPIQDVVSQPQLRFFIFQGSWSRSSCFEGPFLQFLTNNHDFEIVASVDGHEVVIPASSSLESLSERKMFLVNQIDFLANTGSIFSWLQKARVTKPLKIVKSNEGIDSSHEDALKQYLSTCEALVWSGNVSYTNTSILQAHFSKNLCPNLQTVSFNGICPTILLELLPALFASSPQLKELSLSECFTQPGQDQDRLEEVFKCLVSCPYSEQLTLDLRNDEFLKQEAIEKLLQVWRKTGKEKKLKAIILLEHNLQIMVEEMVLQN